MKMTAIRKASKPEKIGNVWTAAATIWIIDVSGEKPVRRNLATCIDTPRHIGNELAKLRKAGLTNLWSTGDASGKKYHG
jgi:hypothetical protein